jgi:rhodanese-related sulfurtransferase/mannose-6-phosphate isomerase-like protein (cupin superfamily)
MAANPQIAHEVPHISSTEETAPVIRRTPAELANIVSLIASSHGWVERVRFRTEERWYERIYHSRDYDIWVISWLPGQSTGFHDHGASSGAFAIATGTLEELRPGQKARIVNAGQSRTFGPDYSHDVRNVSGAPAVSIHAYSPPLSEMNEYEMEGSRLVVRQRSSERVARLDPGWHAQNGKPIDAEPVKSIEQVLTATRTRLRRLSPLEAHEAMHGEGAVLVDIRPESQRLVEGRIEGALVVERNVLEWRFDPASEARLPIAANHDLKVIVFCSEGYTSSLAAASLKELGLWRATDISGGFQAWRNAGLPISS